MYQDIGNFFFFFEGFPGGPVVKNPPAVAGDTGLIPGPGRTLMLQGNQAGVPQLSSPHCEACAPQQEKPLQCAMRSLGTATKSSSCLPKLEKVLT